MAAEKEVSLSPEAFRKAAQSPGRPPLNEDEDYMEGVFEGDIVLEESSVEGFQAQNG